MKNHYYDLLKSLNKKKYVSKKLIRKLEERIAKNNVTKPDNPADHFCSFLVPVHEKTQSIFAGHHIKADEWIPPGGHIEKGERPEGAVRREFTEELSSTLTNETIELFDISITRVFHPSRPCRVHNDFWFAVHMPTKKTFAYDKGEFYDAEWMPLEEAIRRARRKSIIDPLTHLLSLLSSS